MRKNNSYILTKVHVSLKYIWNCLRNILLSALVAVKSGPGHKRYMSVNVTLRKSTHSFEVHMPYLGFAAMCKLSIGLSYGVTRCLEKTIKVIIFTHYPLTCLNAHCNSS